MTTGNDTAVSSDTDRAELLARVAATRVTQPAFGYWQSGVLFELLDSGVVDCLVEAAHCADPAAACGLNPAGTVALLRAGQALGLIEKRTEGWSLLPAARAFLDPASQASLRHWFAVMRRWQAPWARLHEALRDTGAGGGSATLEDDPAYVRDFILGMHEFARLTSDAVIAAAPGVFPRPGATDSLLDVGGGAGTYTVAALRRAGAATATVLDRPDVVAITGEIADREGVSERLRAVAGDYRGRYLQSGDAAHRTVLLSNVLHQEDDAVAVQMLVEARRATTPDGHVVVHTHLVDNERPRLFPALQGVSAFVLWSGGAGMTALRLRTLVARSGLTLHSTVTVKESGTTLAVCR